MSESYEQLRDGATGEGGDAWRATDKEESRLRELYRGLKEDPRYSEEHKSEQAWEAYERVKDKIAANKEKAREKLAKQARTGERFSIPMPGQEPLTTNDTNKLLASQNEAARIVRKIERVDSGKGPFKPDQTEVLRNEYQRGLEVGGVQGGAICRGVLEAADELGVDKHSVVDPFRKERHHESLQSAEHAQRLTQLIGKQVPEPPFKRPGSGRGGDMHTRPNFLVLDRDREQIVEPAVGHTGKKRRPAWK